MAQKFYLWGSFCTEAYVDVFVSLLVRAGYGVSPLASSKDLTCPGELSSLIALDLDAPKDFEATTDRTIVQVALQNIKKILDDRKISHHGLVMHLVGGTFTWSVSNIKLTPKVAATVPSDLRPPTSLDLASKIGDD